MKGGMDEWTAGGSQRAREKQSESESEQEGGGHRGRARRRARLQQPLRGGRVDVLAAETRVAPGRANL
eukprot:135969-Pleurochrysis_carterae.AAC.1